MSVCPLHGGWSRLLKFGHPERQHWAEMRLLHLVASGVLNQLVVAESSHNVEHLRLRSET